MKVPLTDEMIDLARAKGAELGKAAAEALSLKPKIAGQVDRLAASIVREFADLMKNAGLAEMDIAILCRAIREAYLAELPVAPGATKH